MSKQFIILVASAVVVLVGASLAGAALVPDALHRDQPEQPQTSTMNTASQNSFGNVAARTDVNDSPVSLPGERTIQPPRTGNPGLLPAGGLPALPAIVCSLVVLALIATARTATRAQSRGG